MGEKTITDGNEDPVNAAYETACRALGEACAALPPAQQIDLLNRMVIYCDMQLEDLRGENDCC